MKYLRQGALSLLVLVGACRTSGIPERVPVRAPRDAVRFDIASTTDSTVLFRADSAAWLEAGMTGYAVDPLRRDAFVARLALMRREGTRFNALVTGQVRPVDSSHVVVVMRPPPMLFRSRNFWFGALSGAIIGAAGAFILH